MRLGVAVYRAHIRLSKSVGTDGEALGKLVDFFVWNDYVFVWSEE